MNNAGTHKLKAPKKKKRVRDRKKKDLPADLEVCSKKRGKPCKKIEIPQEKKVQRGRGKIRKRGLEKKRGSRGTA